MIQLVEEPAFLLTKTQVRVTVKVTLEETHRLLISSIGARLQPGLLLLQELSENVLYRFTHSYSSNSNGEEK